MKYWSKVTQLQTSPRNHQDKHRLLSIKIHACVCVCVCVCVWCVWHTCHISHCEIKSHRIRSIWKPIPIRFFKSHRILDHLTIHLMEKISQNLAHLEANSHKIFQILQNFRPFYNTSNGEINRILHFVVSTINFVHL